MEKKEYQDQELLHIIKEKFPEISWQIYEVFNNGWDNQVLMLDNSIIFRFPRNEYVKTVHQKERKLLEIVQKYIDINIPEYKFLTDDDSCVGYKAILGKPMTIEIYNTIQPSIQNHIKKQLADFLTQLHAIPIEQFEKIGYPLKSETNNEWTNSFQKEFSEKCGYLFSQQELQSILIYIQELQETNSEYRVMTHSDIQNKNIFIDDTLTNISGIIDFSDARIADPALDFDHLWEYGDEFIHGVYTAYQGNKKHDLLARSKFYRKRLYIYGLIHAVEHKKDIEEHLFKFREIFFGL